MPVKGEEGAGGTESLEIEGQEKEEKEVEVEKLERILNGSHQELKYNWFKGNKSSLLIKVGNIKLQLSKVELESVFWDIDSFVDCV